MDNNTKFTDRFIYVHQSILAIFLIVGGAVLLTISGATGVLGVILLGLGIIEALFLLAYWAFTKNTRKTAGPNIDPNIWE